MEQANSEGAAAIGRKNLFIDWGQLNNLIQDEQTVIIDIRTPEAYCGGHIPGTYCLPQPMLTAYLGWLFDWRDSFAIVGESALQIQRAITDMQRIGYDNVQGAYLFDASMHAAMGNEVESLPTINTQTVQQRLESSGQWTLLDVRKESEVASAKIDPSHHIFLGELITKIDELDKSKAITVMCQSGKRATIGAGILLKHGYRNVDVFSGSMGAWQKNK